MVEKFAEGMNTLIRQILGHSLATGDWAIVTSPKRRHKVCNFASLISARLASLLGIPFYEDIAECHSKHRVGAVFTLGLSRQRRVTSSSLTILLPPAPR